MITATQLKPTVCLDCKAHLPNHKYGRAVDECKDTFGIRPYDLRIVWNSDCIHIVCKCGCIYVWSYDETNQNGGIWKRRHILSLFDDRKRLEITEHQIKRYAR